ncbi:protein-disulfide reductase DsbD [Desulfonema ishimotonii]|uniref:Protein-disulfide reductase DsbD n=1 Tax=Desulfonema ishimotonii TaxID=45657 RepID=A0A401G2F7_9BACT|nr:cytochrome c biogenesis protein CcdA [Desulfonema ishimotonii]GBC63419.1 protein-disulfide reductase DsbD [Desulfonema ishimotonii]
MGLRYIFKKYIFSLVLIIVAAAFGDFTAARAAFFDTPPTTAETGPFRWEAAAVPETVAPGREGTIRVTLKMAQAHKVYASETVILPAPVSGLSYGTLRLPPALEKKEPDGHMARFYEGEAVFDLPVRVLPSARTGAVSVPLTVRYRGCSGKNCFLPREKKIDVGFSVDPATGGGKEVADAPPPGGAHGDQKENPFQKTARRFGLAGVLLAAFAWGFLASLTPCVYPMIPVTVSIIGASNADSIARGFRLSLFYVLGMSLTYAAFGVMAAWSGGLFGAYADHPVVRIIVAGVFFLMALSMFDLFYIQVPAALSSRMGRYSGNGTVGIFLTGAAAGMVVGPCVGPMLVGLLVYIAALGDRLQGFLIMWSFALGMGMLFLVIGTFSGAASGLPRAGAWMEKIKHVFGVIMLGLALYYIRPLVPAGIMMLMTGALLIGIGVFTGALDALQPESGAGDRLRKTVGILCLTLGIVYAARFAIGGHLQASPTQTEKSAIVWTEDEGAGLALARRQNRPAIIDFSADWCAACQKLESETFTHPEVVEGFKNFIAIRVDSTDAGDAHVRRLQKKYGVVGLPTVLFVGPDGRVITEQTITEYVRPSVMLERMRRAAF